MWTFGLHMRAQTNGQTDGHTEWERECVCVHQVLEEMKDSLEDMECDLV